MEQDGALKLVPARAAIKFPPQVDQVYALFADNVEYRPWWVPLDGTLEPGRGEAGGVKETHKLRSEGDSAWDLHWAVEAVFEGEGDWLIPVELRFEGVATYWSFGDACEIRTGNDWRAFNSLV